MRLLYLRLVLHSQPLYFSEVPCSVPGFPRENGHKLSSSNAETWRPSTQLLPSFPPFPVGHSVAGPGSGEISHICRLHRLKKGAENRLRRWRHLRRCLQVRARKVTTEEEGDGRTDDGGGGGKGNQEGMTNESTTMKSTFSPLFLSLWTKH